MTVAQISPYFVIEICTEVHRAGSQFITCYLTLPCLIYGNIRIFLEKLLKYMNRNKISDLISVLQQQTHIEMFHIPSLVLLLLQCIAGPDVYWNVPHSLFRFVFFFFAFIPPPSRMILIFGWKNLFKITILFIFIQTKKVEPVKYLRRFSESGSSFEEEKEKV